MSMIWIFPDYVNVWQAVRVGGELRFATFTWRGWWSCSWLASERDGR